MKRSMQAFRMVRQHQRARHARSMLAIALLACWLAGTSTHPAGADQPAIHSPTQNRDIIAWTSTNYGLDDLPQQIANLYLTLFNIGRLPVKFVADNKGITVEKLMRERGLWYGANFPTQMDSLLCDLNMDVCSRTRVAVPISDLSDYSKHIGGFSPSIATWTNHLGDTLVLPDVEFAKSITVQPYKKSQSESIQSIAVGKRLGCDAYDDNCQDLLRFVNRRLPNFDQANFQGWISMPTLSLAAMIDLSCARLCAGGLNLSALSQIRSTLGSGEEANQWGEQLTQLLLTNSSSEFWKSLLAVDTSKRRAANPDYETNWQSYTEPETEDSNSHDSTKVWLDGLSIGKDSHSAFTAIQQNLYGSPPAPVAQSDIGDEGDYGQEGSMFQFMDFPFINKKFPPEYTRQVTVGVLDLKVDENNCEFLGRGWVIQNLDDTAATANNQNPPAWQSGTGHASGAGPASCQSRSAAVSAEGNVPIDHGSHVVGIIAAALDGIGTVGIDPYARIVAYQLDLTKYGYPDYQLTLGTYLRNEALDQRIEVVNLSNKYYFHVQDTGATSTEATTPSSILTSNAKRDALFDTIRSQGDILFVAAAGNDDTEYTQKCDVWPACFEFDNLISVVGLMGSAKDPKIYNGVSNWGEHFSIGAYADHVVSTGAENKYVTLSGTSQAAPQVTAIAAMLFAKDYKYSPIQVKNRLLSCADVTDSLRLKVWSGKLDADCSLQNVDQDWILKANGDSVVGALAGLEVNSQTATYVQFLDENGNMIDVAWRNIAGLHRLEDGKEFRVYEYQKPLKGDRSPIEKQDNLSLAPGLLGSAIKVVIRRSDGSVDRVSLDDIARYIRHVDSAAQ